jgi:Tfp pilus assembly protein PilZ
MKSVYPYTAKIKGEGISGINERRSHERFPTRLQARLFYGNIIFSGMVTNISKRGMFVNTRIKFPVNSELILALLVDGKVLNIPIRIRRFSSPVNKSGHANESGIGIELLDTPRSYLDFIGRHESSN